MARELLFLKINLLIIKSLIFDRQTFQHAKRELFSHYYSQLLGTVTNTLNHCLADEIKTFGNENNSVANAAEQFYCC
jgi:hypothetical protein